MGTDALVKVQLEEAEQCMRTLAALHGDAYQAAKVLHDSSQAFVTPVQLEAWRKGEYRGIYERFQEEMAQGLEEALVREHREMAARATQLERRLLDKIERDLDSKDIADPSRALTAVTKTKQVSVDKLLSLTGRPTTITESRNAAEIVKQLEALRVLIPIEATAQEMA